MKNLGLIYRAGGLYGKMLTEVVSAERTQWGPAVDTNQVKIFPYRPTNLFTHG